MEQEQDMEQEEDEIYTDGDYTPTCGVCGEPYTVGEWEDKHVNPLDLYGKLGEDCHADCCPECNPPAGTTEIWAAITVVHEMWNCSEELTGDQREAMDLLRFELDRMLKEDADRLRKEDEDRKRMERLNDERSKARNKARKGKRQEPKTLSQPETLSLFDGVVA